MRRRPYIFALVALCAASAAAERQPFERYRTVVDRQMFGAPPAGFDPTKMPSEVAKTKAKAGEELTAEQEQVKKAIKFSVLNVTPSGETVVGFSDNGDPKNPLHYYLKVGESQNGWTVKEADPEAATMTIEKDGIEVTLKLGGDSASNAAAVSRKGGGGEAAPRPGRSLLSTGRSLRSRRLLERQQMEADAAKREEAEKAREAAETERAAREAEANKQREAEREEQRRQLQQIQEELRKVRENKAKESNGENEADGDDNQKGEA